MGLGLDIIKIIKYEGADDMLVWKHPAEDFNTASQLIVHESQEAILFKDGRALDVFGPGRYVLETDNIPILRRIINLPAKGNSPFHCEVYFVNKADILDVLWGTSQPVPIQDPVYHMILPVRANGQFGLHVSDSRRLVVKLTGTARELSKKRVAELFRGMLMTKAKSLIAGFMTTEKISFVDVNSRLSEISEAIRKQAAPMYSEYGMEIVNFFVNSVSVPSDDPGYVKLRTAIAQAKEKEVLARGEKAQMDILGYSYQEKRTFDILDKAAQNEGSGAGIMGAGIGMGLGVNVGGMVGNAMGEAMGTIQGTGAGRAGGAFSGALREPEQATYAADIRCPSCGMRLPKGAKFCHECGAGIRTDCPSCGAKLVAGAKFCSECGRRI